MTACQTIQTDTALTNLEAEAHLLGTLLVENSLIGSVADIIESQDFFAPVHSNIFDAILHHAMNGKPANPVSLKPYFEGNEAMSELGGASYMMRLTESAGFMDALHLAKDLRDLSIRRDMRDGLAEASALCSDMDAHAADIIDAADKAIAVRAKDQIHQPSGADCFDEMFAAYEDNSLGVLCGQIPGLDELLGPLRPKQLIIAAGRPGMGKTALALSYALGAAQRGHGVLFASLEMSSTELAQRMAADMCFDGRSIPFNAIRDNNLTSAQRIQLLEARNKLHQLPFQVVDAGSLTVGRLNMIVRRHARRMAAKGHSLDLVVVDYLQLLHPDTKGRSNYEAVSEVSRSLKAMAKDNGVAIMALAQLSREVEKRPKMRPQLSDLRDSGQIEQDADAVVFLLREEYYLRANEIPQGHPDRLGWEQSMDEVAGQIQFILAKRRNGTTGTVTCAFHGQFQAVR